MSIESREQNEGKSIFDPVREGKKFTHKDPFCRNTCCKSYRAVKIGVYRVFLVRPQHVFCVNFLADYGVRGEH